MHVFTTKSVGIASVVIALAFIPPLLSMDSTRDADATPVPVGGGGGEQPAPVATDPLASTLIRVGLDAEALAAAGVSSTDIPALVSNAEAFVTANPAALAVADAAFASARQDADRLKRLVQSGLGSPADVTAYQQACVERDAAKTTRQGVLDDLRENGVTGCSLAQVATLSAIQANRHWRLPVQYLVVNRDQADWVKLRDCLGNELKAPELGDEPDADCQAWLATVRGNATVAAAQANLNTHLAGVNAAWNLALSD